MYNLQHRLGDDMKPLTDGRLILEPQKNLWCATILYVGGTYGYTLGIPSEILLKLQIASPIAQEIYSSLQRKFFLIHQIQKSLFAFLDNPNRNISWVIMQF